MPVRTGNGCSQAKAPPAYCMFSTGMPRIIAPTAAPWTKATSMRAEEEPGVPEPAHAARCGSGTRTRRRERSGRPASAGPAGRRRRGTPRRPPERRAKRLAPITTSQVSLPSQNGAMLVIICPRLASSRVVPNRMPTPMSKPSRTHVDQDRGGDDRRPRTGRACSGPSSLTPAVRLAAGGAWRPCRRTPAAGWRSRSGSPRPRRPALRAAACRCRRCRSRRRRHRPARRR